MGDAAWANSAALRRVAHWAVIPRRERSRRRAIARPPARDAQTTRPRSRCDSRPARVSRRRIPSACFSEVSTYEARPSDRGGHVVHTYTRAPSSSSYLPRCVEFTLRSITLHHYLSGSIIYCHLLRPLDINGFSSQDVASHLLAILVTHLDARRNTIQFTIYQEYMNPTRTRTKTRAASGAIFQVQFHRAAHFSCYI